MRANTIKYEAFVLGVALFGSLVAGEGAFMAGLHLSLVICALVLLMAAAVIGLGAPARGRTV